MKEIPLSRGFVAVVDDHWYDILTANGKTWYEHEGYAVRKDRVPGEANKWTVYRMHRVVAKCDDPEMIVDHINGDKLCNLEENLRIATKTENNRNVKKTWESSSQYKGVTYSPKADKPWVAQIGYGNKRVYLGAFYTEEQAAHIYNLAARELYGEFADLNQIEGIENDKQANDSQE